MKSNDINILIIDDTPEDLHLLSQIVAEAGYQVRAVTSESWALAAIQSAPPDLILLNITLPAMNGYDVCRRLKEDTQTCDIPIIFISALNALGDRAEIFAVGGADYIIKPYQAEEVVARIRLHLSRRDGREQLQTINRDAALKLQLEKQYRQAQKMESVGRLAGGLAHDFNNLLTSIMGHAALALDLLPDDAASRSDIEIIQQNAEQAAGLVRQLLAFARHQVIEPYVQDSDKVPARQGDSYVLPRGTETVLLAEDDVSVRYLAVRVLREQGYNVLEASNGYEALALIQEQGRQIQLLLTDIAMPGISGKMLAEQLKAIYPEAKTLFISGYTDSTIARHHLLEPNHHLLQKPFTPGKLTQKVRQTLDDNQ